MSADTDDSPTERTNLGAGRPLSWSDFESFYLHEHRGLERALIVALGDLELGRDATAEGFARALHRWRRVSRTTNPSGWVYRVGLNWARSRIRRERRDRSPVAPASATSTDLSSERLSLPLIEALQQIPDHQRAVIVGRFVLDWSEADVAAALRIKPGTAKSRTSRGLAQLAELLEDHRDR